MRRRSAAPSYFLVACPDKAEQVAGSIGLNLATGFGSGLLGSFLGSWLVTAAGRLAPRLPVAAQYYIADIGLVNAATTKVDAEKCWKLENVVFMALRRGLNRISYIPLPNNRLIPKKWGISLFVPFVAPRAAMWYD